MQSEIQLLLDNILPQVNSQFTNVTKQQLVVYKGFRNEEIAFKVYSAAPFKTLAEHPLCPDNVMFRIRLRKSSSFQRRTYNGRTGSGQD